MPSPECGTDEIVKGELRFVSVRLWPHAEVISRVNSALIRQKDETVQILGAGFGLMISREPLTCRCPDLALWRRRDKMVVQDGLLWSSPDLVVEVISPSETKRRKEEKLADYAAIGVPEAWLVSPEARSVEIRLLVDGQLTTTSVLVAGELHPTQFPEVSIPVAAIWPD